MSMLRRQGYQLQHQDDLDVTTPTEGFEVPEWAGGATEDEDDSVSERLSNSKDRQPTKHKRHYTEDDEQDVNEPADVDDSNEEGEEEERIVLSINLGNGEGVSNIDC